MKILLIGEASFVHNTLKKGLVERGHQVTTMSDGNGWHNAPRDIDLRRSQRWIRINSLKVVWQLLRHLPSLMGNDVVQIHNYQFIPLKYRWNTLFLRFLKRHNRCIVKGCFGDDPQIFRRQAMGVPSYSDTYWHGKLQNIEANKQRIAEVEIPSAVDAWKESSLLADALVPCLYEYWLCYNEAPFANKLHYISLPMVIPSTDDLSPKGQGNVIKVLVGLQPKREFLKGAMKIAQFVKALAQKHPGKIEIKYVEGVPYDEYCRMIEEVDVLVDQFYSYTPSMNTLAAMARGTVVIGGGEEEYYRFIGEEKLRPIINVSPEYSDETNIDIIEKAFFTEGNLAKLSLQSIAFVKKYHDYRKVAAQYEQLYREILSVKLP